MNTSERLAMLMFRHVRKELTRAEKMELAAWRNARPENERVFQGTTNKENILVDLGAFLSWKERGLQKLKDNHPEIWKNSPVMRLSHIYKLVRYAAIILVSLGLTVYFLLSGKSYPAGEYKGELVSTDGAKTVLSDFQRGFLAGKAGIKIDKTESGELIYNAPNDVKKGKDEMYTLRTDRGGEFVLRFPDSTMIRINAETSIQYPANFSQDTINVSLTGEAYFELAKSSAHYYDVSLGPRPKAQGLIQNAIHVESSGGQFNISSYPDDSLKFITLLNGSAKILMDSAGKYLNAGYELKPGQQARIMNQNFAIMSDADTLEIVAWKNGQTIFHNADIQTIMQMASRWYNVDINYGAGIPDKKFNIDIPRNSNLSVLLESLRKQDLQISIRGKTVTIAK